MSDGNNHEPIVAPGKGNGRRLIIALLALGIVFLPGTARAVDTNGWTYVRGIDLPADLPPGPVAVPLQSSVIEKCRPDMADLMVVTSEGKEVPLKLEGTGPIDQAEALPARVRRVSRRPGKWTDIQLDKSGKILTRAIAIQTDASDFVRRVEIRGSDNSRDIFVLRMDGLILNRPGPVPVRDLKIRHPLNNFQYIYLRIHDGDRPPLTIKSVLCYPPDPEPLFPTPLPLRIVENRSDQEDNSTRIIADLGKKRFPVRSITISTPETELIKRARLSCASSASSRSWNPVFEGIFFRVREGEAVKENLSARFKAQPSRFLMLELSGAGSPPIEVSGIAATGAIPAAIFEYRRGETYRLFYGNRRAKASSGEERAPEMDRVAGVSISSGVRLGKEEKNVAAPTEKRRVKQTEYDKTDDWWMLTASGLLLFFAIALGYLWVRKGRRNRPSRILDIR